MLAEIRFGAQNERVSSPFGADSVRPSSDVALRATVVIVLGALGCSENSGPNPGPPPAFTVTPSAQWSAGVVQVRSSSFICAQLPVIMAGAETLSTVRVDDSSVVVTLPRAPTSHVLLHTVAGDSVGSVEVFGLRSARTVPGSMGYEPLVPP